MNHSYKKYIIYLYTILLKLKYRKFGQFDPKSQNKTNKLGRREYKKNIIDLVRKIN